MDIDPHLQTILVRGEISNFKHHSRGHMYLTIKDKDARIQAVMFAGNNRHLKFRPEDGMKVLIKGQVTIFEAFGQYQLYIREMEPDGIGALYLAFEQLKKKLVKEGLFDQIHKQQISEFPEHIGIITSPTGAAIRDMITTIKRRYPIVKITIFPVAVQGEDAVDNIYNAIQQVNSYKGSINTIILGRGGGSIEDLWAFNEEKVIRAVFTSTIPIISGVGHETDTSLTDFVADLRAPTPTGAAELAVPSIIELHKRIQQAETRLMHVIDATVGKKREKVRLLQQSYAFHKPKLFLQEKEQHIDLLTDRLTRQLQLMQERKKQHMKQLQNRLIQTHPRAKLEDAQKQLQTIVSDQHRNSAILLQRKQQQLNVLIYKLTLLNPLHIMNRGFAIPYAKDGTIIKKIQQVNPSQEIDIRLTDGTMSCSVHDVWRHTDD